MRSRHQRKDGQGVSYITSVGQSGRRLHPFGNRKPRSSAAAAVHVVEPDACLRFMAALDGSLTKSRDRELFGLAPLLEAAEEADQTVIHADRSAPRC